MDALTALGMAPLAFDSLFLGRAAWGNQGVVRGRRSTDQAERDFLAVATINGYRVVDGADLVAWSQGGDVLVTTLYEQMGSGLHAIQTTAALQPYLVTAGVLETMAGAPAIRFDPALNQRLIAPILIPDGACTIAATALVNSASSSHAIYGSPTIAGGGAAGRTAIVTNGGLRFGGDVGLPVGSALSVPAVRVARADGAGASFISARVNGVSYGPAAITRGTNLVGFYLGNLANNTGGTMDGIGGDWCLIDGAQDLAVVGPIIARLRGLVG